MRPGTAPPRVAIALDGIEARARGSWRVRWIVRTDRPVTVLQAWHPHRRFRSSRLARRIRIPARSQAILELPARTDAIPGEVVENSFLILRIASDRERFRVLARFTFDVSADGTPRPEVKAVDVHPADG